jgi:hypothetical protein
MRLRINSFELHNFNIKFFSNFCPILQIQSLLVFNNKNLNKMKDFLFVFRSDPSVPAKWSPEEMQAVTKKWMDWVGGIAAQNKLTDRGNRLVPAGKVVKPGSIITDGPYTEIKEIIAGYTIVKTETIEEAAEIAKGCPVFAVGGTVEVREISIM